MRTQRHTHPCRYCDRPLQCTGEPGYSCGYEGAFCLDEAEFGPVVCDDCEQIVWCGMCGEIEAMPGHDECAACVEDGE